MADQVNIAPIARRIFEMEIDFPTWFRQFVNYCVITNTPAAQRFGVICSFLDSAAFTTVENLRLANEIRADINAALQPLNLCELFCTVQIREYRHVSLSGIEHNVKMSL